MSEEGEIRSHIELDPVPRSDWWGRAGKVFRKILHAAADLGRKHADHQGNAGEATGKFIRGHATEKYEQAKKAAAERENLEIQKEEKLRNAGTDDLIKQATARKIDAEALMAELEAEEKALEIEAKRNFYKALNNANAIFTEKPDGTFIFLKAPKGVKYQVPDALPLPAIQTVGQEEPEFDPTQTLVSKPGDGDERVHVQLHDPTAPSEKPSTEGS